MSKAKKSPFERRIPDDIFCNSLLEHGGNYYEYAHEIGEPPYKVYRRAAKVVGVNNRLSGMIAVWHDGGQRLQQARKFQRENAKLRKEVRAIADLREFNAALQKAMDGHSVVEVPKPRKLAPEAIKHEWLFSDLHYGKSCEGYGSPIAMSRVMTYAEAIRAEQKREKPVATTIAFMGDLIENTLKHRDSQIGCGGMGVAEQIVGSYRLIAHWLDLVLERAGKQIVVIGVSGNHENPLGAGAMMSWQGRNHLTYIIYHLLMDKFSGDKRISWVIPRGNYAHYEGAVYEHGDDVQPTERAMSEQLYKRSRQVGAICNRYRQGDKHVAVAADAGNLICNGAFFSDSSGTEFSGVKGYKSQPCQVGIIGSGVKFVRFD